jgi:transcription initiation factor TFIID subunit 2
VELIWQYTDGWYIATLLSGLGNLLGASPDPRAATAVEKAITMDRLIPSFGNVITKAGLEAHLKSIMIGQVTNDPRLFLSYTRYVISTVSSLRHV